MTISRRDAIAVSGTALAGLSTGALDPSALAAQEQEFPDRLVDVEPRGTFPVDLPRRLIELYTFEGDLVLDPFMGVASTAVAAVETGRDYVGFEINPEYVDLAERRLSDSLG